MQFPAYTACYSLSTLSVYLLQYTERVLEIVKNDFSAKFTEKITVVSKVRFVQRNGRKSHFLQRNLICKCKIKKIQWFSGLNK